MLVVTICGSAFVQAVIEYHEKGGFSISYLAQVQIFDKSV